MFKQYKEELKNENYIDFGLWLYELRKEKGYTEEQLMDKIALDNVQVKNIKKWERDIEFPDADAIYKLSEIYMIPASEIIQKKNETLMKGIEGININFIRTLSLIMGISIYGAVGVYYIMKIMVYIAFFLVLFWFRGLVFKG